MPLTDLFIPVLAYVSDFLATVQEKPPPYTEVRAAVERLLAQADSGSARDDYGREDLDDARFAVCAWIDETVLGSPWAFKDLWLKEQLQRSSFNTTAAGEEFFDRLNGLAADRREVREIYYLCLALGFTGRFCRPGDEVRLLELKRENLKLLLGTAALFPAGGATLFPEAYPSSDRRAAPLKKRFPVSTTTLLCLGAPLLLFALLLIIYRLILGSVGQSLLTTMTL